jgi:signal transduction histidine kinase/tetratricopeptide (TPR) repeat protein
MKKILSFFLLTPFFSIAQNSQYKIIDSLKGLVRVQKEDTTLANLYNQISFNYIYQNADTGIYYAQKGLAISQKLNWQKGIGDAYLQMGSHFTSKGIYDSTVLVLNLALKKFAVIENDYYSAKVYNQLGILQGNKGNYPDALDYFFKSLSIFENSSNPNKQTSVAAAFENIGTIYNFTEQYDKAILYLEKCIAVLQKLDKTESQIALNFTNIGTVYQKQGNAAKAIESFEKAEKVLADQTDYFATAFLNSSWGITFLKNDDFVRSIEKSRLALTAATISGDKELITSITQNLGYAQFKQGCLQDNKILCKEGYNNILKSLSFYKELGSQEGLRKAYLYLSEYYAAGKDYKNALKMHQLFAAYNDSIYNIKNKQSLQNLEDQRTIDLNKKEIELNKLSLANKEKQKWFYIAGIILVSCIGFLFFYQSSNSKKTNKKLEELNKNLDEANKIKARFFSILNHDLRSPVANLIQFLHLQKDSPESFDEASKLRLHQKTITGAENLLASMEDILLWSKGQMINFKPTLKDIAISDLFTDTQKHFDSFEKISINFLTTDLKIYTDENYLKTIMRNFTANAIKALEDTASPSITWKAWQEGNKLFLSISDNGPGASSGQLKALYDEKEVVGTKTGLGLHLIRDLAKAIHSTIRIQSNAATGTTFILEFSAIQAIN